MKQCQVGDRVKVLGLRTLRKKSELLARGEMGKYATRTGTVVEVREDGWVNIQFDGEASPLQRWWHPDWIKGTKSQPTITTDKKPTDRIEVPLSKLTDQYIMGHLTTVDRTQLWQSVVSTYDPVTWTVSRDALVNAINSEVLCSEFRVKVLELLGPDVHKAIKMGATNNATYQTTDEKAATEMLQAMNKYFSHCAKEMRPLNFTPTDHEYVDRLMAFRFGDAKLDELRVLPVRRSETGMKALFLRGDLLRVRVHEFDNGRQVVEFYNPKWEQ